MRNGLVTSIAPTGTISLLAGNVSSGIEPVFDLTYSRRILAPSGKSATQEVEDYAYRAFREAFGADAALPDYFVTAQDLMPAEHLRMQAALQPHVDASISKTVNAPASTGFAAFETLYKEAYVLGLKGCTVYRPNAVTGSVLISAASGNPTRAPAEPAAPALPAALSPTKPDERHGDIVYMAKPLERDPVLSGATYKLKWPNSDHALYVTINDIVQDGRKRPFEIFINSKNLEHYAWTVALTRMISAVFRRGGDITFVVEELKAVFDPRGGQWMGGRTCPPPRRDRRGDREASARDRLSATAGGTGGKPPARSERGHRPRAGRLSALRGRRADPAGRVPVLPRLRLFEMQLGR